MDDEVLITLVQNYEELYNLKHSQYSNQQRRDNIWEEIGNIMKLSSKMCRERWARIRENHRKALNLRKTKSGQASKKIKTPKFDQQLTFLVPYLFDEESRHSNISKPSSQAPPSTPGSGGDESEHAEEDYSQPVNRDTSPPPVTSVSSSSRSATATPGTERKKRKSSVQPTSAAMVLQDYLETRKSQSVDNNTTKSEDALTKFFLSMAETVKGFPLRDQLQIKSKLFEMVNAVEFKMLSYEANAGTSQNSLPVVSPQSLTSVSSASDISSNPRSQPLNSEGISQGDPYQPNYYDLDYHSGYGGDQ